MTRLINLIDRLPLLHVVLVAFALGLAPFRPMPHLVEKLMMLKAGALTQSVDMFDLAMHGVPVVLLIVKLVLSLRKPLA
ncbi:RND transporter [Halocynthiibacter sp.]|uniref:RND transporter n=1 Tax=Halocynthiibacter sp. TaxID=1979210 RepID=UPI003C5FD7BC